MKDYIEKCKPYLRHKPFLSSSASAILLLIASLFVNFFAGSYAAQKESNPVTDIILSNIRVYNVDDVFVYGAITLVAVIAILCFLYPKTLPFTIKTIALFVLVRSVFITLTHIATFPSAAVIDSNILSKFTFGGDLFFSGHTGLPFLMGLIFWENKYLRLAFIVTSAVFGIVVLMGHLHYTIDVVAAFFITYAIFHIAEFFFKKDRRIFKEGI